MRRQQKMMTSWWFEGFEGDSFRGERRGDSFREQPQPRGTASSSSANRVQAENCGDSRQAGSTAGGLSDDHYWRVDAVGQPESRVVSFTDGETCCLSSSCLQQNSEQR